MGQMHLGHATATEHMAQLVPPAEATRLIHDSCPLRSIPAAPVVGPAGVPRLGHEGSKLWLTVPAASRAPAPGRPLIRNRYRVRPGRAWYGPVMCMTCDGWARLSRCGQFWPARTASMTSLAIGAASALPPTSERSSEPFSMTTATATGEPLSVMA